MAGCISSIRGNGLGTAGIAPASPSISVRVFESDVAACDGSWWTFWSWTINALDWGLSQGIRVTNNSNFYGASPTSIVTAYDAAAAAGQVHFASAGNSGAFGMEFPASIDSVQAIGATNRFGNRASFSNFGSQLAMVAPGLDVWSTDLSGSDGYTNNDHALVYGTSFASPLAAGVVAAAILGTLWFAFRDFFALQVHYATAEAADWVAEQLAGFGFSVSRHSPLNSSIPDAVCFALP